FAPIRRLRLLVIRQQHCSIRKLDHQAEIVKTSKPSAPADLGRSAKIDIIVLVFQRGPPVILRYAGPHIADDLARPALMLVIVEPESGPMIRRRWRFGAVEFQFKIGARYALRRQRNLLRSGWCATFEGLSKNHRHSFRYRRGGPRRLLRECPPCQ